MSIQSLFYPRGVAVVGSMSEGKLGWELIRKIVRGGYQNVFAVNPKAQGAFDVPGYDAVSKIGQPVDLAVIVAPPQTVPSVLEDCGRAGVKAAAIITAGFSEVGNKEGEAELKRVAAEQGIRFIGPNCAGLINTRHNLYPTLETHPPAGGVAIVAQSGRWRRGHRRSERRGGRRLNRVGQRVWAGHLKVRQLWQQRRPERD